MFLWSMGVPGGPRGVPGGSPKGPRGSPGGPWEASGARGRSVRSLGSILWARRYSSSSLKMSKNVNNCKKHINKFSKPVQNRYLGVQNYDFWLRNPGSKGDPWGISVGSCGKRSARDSERVVSSIYIYIYIYIHMHIYTYMAVSLFKV